MHGEHPIEIPGRQFREPGLMHMAGIADQVSGIAKRFPASRYNRRDVVLKGDIAAYGDSLSAIAPDLRSDAFGLIKNNVVHRHSIAVAG
jgi:hypothetical protein